MLAAVTVLLWCVVMYVGSRTAADGFPQRFERDLGAPLSVVAAFGLVIVVRALLAQRAGARTALTAAAAAAAVVVGAVVAVQAARGLAASAGPNREVLTHRVAAAGRWLGQHNTGGNIISTPYMNPGITNRAVLAMGGYTGLQSYGAFRIAHPRSLPPAAGSPCSTHSRYCCTRLAARPQASWPATMSVMSCSTGSGRVRTCGLRHGPQPVPPGLPEPLGHHLRGRPSPMPGGLSPAPPRLFTDLRHDMSVLGDPSDSDP